jgi:hypothetical protein
MIKISVLVLSASLVALTPAWAQHNPWTGNNLDAVDSGPNGDWAARAKQRFQAEHPDVADRVRRRSEQGLAGSDTQPLPPAAQGVPTMGGSPGARPPVASQVDNSTGTRRPPLTPEERRRADSGDPDFWQKFYTSKHPWTEVMGMDPPTGAPPNVGPSGSRSGSGSSPSQTCRATGNGATGVPTVGVSTSVCR